MINVNGSHIPINLPFSLSSSGFSSGFGKNLNLYPFSTPFEEEA